MWISADFPLRNAPFVSLKKKPHSGRTHRDSSFETTLMSYTRAVYGTFSTDSFFFFFLYWIIFFHKSQSFFAQSTMLYNRTLFLSFLHKKRDDDVFCTAEVKNTSLHFISWAVFSFDFFLPWCRCSWNILWWYSATTLYKYLSLFFSLHAFNHCITWWLSY